MPSRHSDRGRILAKALRDDPEFEQAKMVAEFTEPYGTAAAVGRIAEGDADWLDYAAAVPVLGLPARYAKRFKSIEKAAEAVKAHKSKEVLTEMDIDDFLSLAEQGYDAQKAERLVGVEQFDDVPYLKFSPDGDVAKITGHEGRHRAMALKEMGESKMPVLMRGDEVRFDHQNPKDWDFLESWPTKIESEGGEMVGKFPIKQGQSGVIEEVLEMDLNPTDTQALIETLLKEFDF